MLTRLTISILNFDLRKARQAPDHPERNFCRGVWNYLCNYSSCTVVPCDKGYRKSTDPINIIPKIISNKTSNVPKM